MTIGGKMVESKIREIAKLDVPMLQDELGDPQTVTLTPFGGEPTEITVIVAEIDGAGRLAGDGHLIDHRKTWMVAKSDLPDPKDYKDTIKSGGKKYTLDNHRTEGAFWRAEWTLTEQTKRVGSELYRDKA
jgi:hypothetical protein